MRREPQARAASIDEFIAYEILLLEAAVESTFAAAEGWRRLLRTPPRELGRVLRETREHCREPFTARMQWLRRSRGGTG